MATRKPDLSLLPSDDAPPLAEMAKEYLVSCRSRGLSLRTIDNYEHCLFQLFLPWCELEGIREPGHLNRRVLERYAGKLHQQGGKSGRALSKDSVHTYLRPVNSFTGWLREEGEAATGKAPLPRLPKRDVDVLSRDEINALEQAAGTERDRLIIRVLGDTGMRRGELVALTIDDLVERGRGRYYLRAHGKAQKDRLVAIGPSLWRRLKAFVGHTRPAEARSEHVFLSSRRGRTGDYERLTGSAVQQLVALLAREAGLTKAVYPHLLRHSFITAMVIKGVPAEVIAHHVGHESIQMISRVYAHIKTETSHDLIIRALTES
jgi:site-specific recombinase XerD